MFVGGAAYCQGDAPSLAWTPDRERLTVLDRETLTTHDLDGDVLDSGPTTIQGPLVWREDK